MLRYHSGIRPESNGPWAADDRLKRQSNSAQHLLFVADWCLPAGSTSTRSERDGPGLFLCIYLRKDRIVGWVGVPSQHPNRFVTTDFCEFNYVESKVGQLTEGLVSQVMESQVLKRVVTLVRPTGFGSTHRSLVMFPH